MSHFNVLTSGKQVVVRIGSLLVVLLVVLMAPRGAMAQSAPRSQPYTWKSVQMVGGGFVDGIIFHPTVKGLAYARTDIGGAYRRDDQHSPWIAITDWVSLRDVALMGPESIAVDPNDPNKVYIAAGMYATQRAAILRSNDRGKTFQRTDVPFTMGGNADGRGNGERMMVDPNDGNIIYFGSRTAGLWKSTDGAVTWTNVSSFPAAASSGGGRGGRGNAPAEQAAAPATAPATTAAARGRGRGGVGGGGGGAGSGIIFVVFDPRSGSKGKASSIIYAGVSLMGQENVFRSKDAGQTWEPVPGQPTALRPTHGVWSPDGTLYISYSTVPGPGGNASDGAVWKLNATSGQWTDITPVKPGGDNGAFGYVAVSVDAQHPSTVIASTFRHPGTEEIFRTTDAGKTWKAIIRNGASDSVYDNSGHPYTVHTGIHWLFDIEIDPFDSNHAIFTVGYGGWETFNLTDADAGKPVKWVAYATGIEETVALSLLSPTDGAHLVSAIGDYGGFVHWDLDKPAPEGNFTNPFFGNTNDVSAGEKNPSVIVRVGTQGGGQNGGARGSIGYSLDSGKTWQPPKNPPAGSNGFVAVSTDGNRWIWSPGGGGGRGGRGGGSGPSVTSDRGETWAPCNGLPAGTRVIADPVNPMKFYGINLFGNAFFSSTDGGINFTSGELNLPGGAPAAGGRGNNRGDNRGGQDKIYATPGIEGDLWVAAFDGLYHSTNSGKTFAKLDSGVSELHAFGFGKAAPGASMPAIYTVATISGVRGVFRSDDGAKSWVRINDDEHQWGLILQITGDPRIYGRVYVGTHGRGTLYGDPPAGAR
jgi:hypothetical protein